MQRVVCLYFFVLAGSFGFLQAQSSAAVVNYSNAQQFMNDANGLPMYIHSEYNMEGSPFYSNEYCYANLKVRNGKFYTGIKVKLNLLENIVVYDAGDGKEMAATSPIERIVFNNCSDPEKNKILVSGYPATAKQDLSSFYVLLDSGALQLLKYIMITYRDTKYYGNQVLTRIFEQKEIYYVYEAGKGMTHLPKENESVVSLLNKNKQDLLKFIEANNIRCKRENDLVKLFRFYNSLNR